MYVSRLARSVLGAFTALVLLVLYFPIAYIARLSVNTAKTYAWPPRGFTLEWWRAAAHASGPRDALVRSLETALLASTIALILGTLASFALTRHRFFGRNVVSLMAVLPIALPGIVTGIALNSGFHRVGVNLSLFTLVVAHATFCIVIVYNNVAARLRRLAPSLEEASADLGADIFQTFGYVTFPLMRSALVAGGLLAFALSFDEIIVTTFTAGAGFETLPLWIFNNMFRPNNLPLVNVVATVVVLLSIVPVYIAQRLSDGVVGATGH
ncbi:MAG: spermidine/putrescine transporter permease [Actinomycetia bacterium]|nr:spermidine/putrescine transporter permease [Actinomycetes bacterium]